MQRPERTIMASLFTGALLLSVMLVPLASCHDHESKRRPVIRRARDVATTGCYIVAMKDDTREDQLQDVLRKAVRASDDAKVYGMVQRVKKAFTVKLNPYALEMVRHLPGVDYIEEEGFAVGDQDDTVLPWHVDRLDQNFLPLDFNYSPIGDGRGVDVYILDSGINYDHEEFERRAKYGGYDPVDEYNHNPVGTLPRQYGRDCHGHGTHVASLCGGKTYGSAKKVNIYSIRVLACNNAAPWSVVIDGLDYVSGVASQRGRPAIVSMSLSGAYHKAVNDIVDELVSEGITVVTVAGNGKADSCSRSPGSSDSAITVAASSSVDGLYSSTNYGLCVDIFAPGSRILAADNNCTKCSKYLSGTSMAAPIVSGIAAVHLSRKPILTPAAVKSLLISESISNVLVYNEEVIPAIFWERTKNRLVQLTGSCGGSDFFLNSGTVTSPDYPANYPPNLCCVWSITGEDDQFIVFDLWYLHLEDKYDKLKVYDGPCSDESNLVDEFTGYRGEVRYTYRTDSNMLCLKLVTDGTNGFKGFNATYSKFYNGTDIKVPDTIPLPTAPPNPLAPEYPVDYKVILKMPPRQARSEVLDLEADGYKILWVSPYRVGQDQKPYFDVILTNATEADAKGYLDLSHTVMNRTIYDMKLQGYSAEYIVDRDRGKNPSAPSYSAVFTRKNNIFETEVFLRDSLQEYENRLTSMKADGYRLLSHSFCEIQGQLEVVSVYERDRRLAYNISVPESALWQSYYNLSFFKFSEIALTLGREGYYPSYVESYNFGASTEHSKFAAVFEQPIGVNLNWFRWALNTTSARYTIDVELEDSIWQPLISLAYTYLGNVRHYLGFTRRRYN